MTNDTRKPIQHTDSIQHMLIKMSEGNPGALSVLIGLVKLPLGVLFIMHLEDMNMRGEQIWVAWKDYCKQDINRFTAALENRDPELVAVVNAQCPSKPKAVTHGGMPGYV